VTSAIFRCPACGKNVRAFKGVEGFFEQSPMRARKAIELDGIDTRRMLVWLDHAELCPDVGTGTHGAVAEAPDGSTPAQPEIDLEAPDPD